MFLHLKIKFITRHSIFFSIYENWEIRIIVAYSWYIIEKGYPFNTLKFISISYGYFATGIDCMIYLLKVK